jgi:hypothetical protein
MHKILENVRNSKTRQKKINEFEFMYEKKKKAKVVSTRIQF